MLYRKMNRITRKLRFSALAACGCRRQLIAGSIIPQEDASALERQGIARLFGPGTPTADIVEFITRAVELQRT